MIIKIFLFLNNKIKTFLYILGNVVKRATENVVRAARQAMKTDEIKNLILNERMVGGMAQEIDARSDVLRIERELNEARKRLVVIRQAKNKSVDSY